MQHSVPLHSPDPQSESTSGVLAARVSRRGFMQSLGASAAAATVANSAQALVTAKEAERAAAKNAPAVMGPGPVEMTLNVNGQPRPIKVEPCTTLLAALREHLGMTGSKEICDRGACGGCSVIIDGTLTVSCMMLAIDRGRARQGWQDRPHPRDVHQARCPPVRLLHPRPCRRQPLAPQQQPQPHAESDQARPRRQYLPLRHIHQRVQCGSRSQWAGPLG